MTCNDYQRLLSAYLDRQLSVEDQKAVTSHLAQCADCQEESNALLSLKERLRRYSLPAMPDDLRAQIEAKTMPSVWFPRRMTIGLTLAAALGAWLLLRQHQTPRISAPVEIVQPPLTQIQEHPRMAMHQDPNSEETQGCLDKPVGC